MKKITIGILIFLSLYFFARFYLAWTNPNSESAARVNFTITPGMPTKKIVALLDEYELIRDPLAFRIYLKYKGLDSSLQAGDYVINKNLTFEEITATLLSGKGKEIKITIPEGSTIKQIDQILANHNLINQGDFEECIFRKCSFNINIDGQKSQNLEGYLYPSTYYVNPEQFSSQSFTIRLYRQLQKLINPIKVDIDYRYTLDDVIKVASMIERESFGDNQEEKQIIAGIIWSRLEQNIPLGIDATTRYELNDWKNEQNLANAIRQKTPYNTRLNLGLPPTAISNPGIKSIKAAIYPKRTEYLYYLHDRSGQIHFSQTNYEHNLKRQKYLWLQ